MVSVRPGCLLAAGFGVAPSTARHAEEPPLSRALQRAGSLAARTIREANRFVNASSSSSLPSASRAPALAALALVVLSVLSIAAGRPASLVFSLVSAAAASSLVAWSRSRSAAEHLSVPPSLGMSSTSALLAGSPARKASLLSAAAVSSSSASASLSPTKGGSGSSSSSTRLVTVVVDAGCRTPEITAAE